MPLGRRPVTSALQITGGPETIYQHHVIGCAVLSVESQQRTIDDSVLLAVKIINRQLGLHRRNNVRRAEHCAENRLLGFEISLHINRP